MADDVRLNMPVGQLRVVNGLITRIAKDMQQLIGINNSVAATMQEVMKINNLLHSLAGNSDRLWDNLHKRAVEDESVLAALIQHYEGVDKDKVVGNSRQRISDINFSARPLSFKELRIIRTLADKLDKLDAVIKDVIKSIPKIKKSIEQGFLALDELRYTLDNSVIEVKYAVKAGDQEQQLSKVISGNLFTTVAAEAAKFKDNPNVQQTLRSLVREMDSTESLIKRIGEALNSNAVAVERILTWAEDVSNKIELAQKVVATATDASTRGRQALSNLLDVLTVTGIVGGVSISVLAAPAGVPVAAAVALLVGFGARVVKTVLGLFNLVGR